MNAKPCIALAVLCVAGTATTASIPVSESSPSDLYLKPDLKVGEHLTDMFSKSVSYVGVGIRKFPHAGRYGGGAAYVVIAVLPDGLFVTSEQDVAAGTSIG